MNGRTLRALREARVLSQRDLAALAGVAEATIVRLESGNAKPNFATLRKLAAALNVAPERFSVGNGENPAEPQGQDRRVSPREQVRAWARQQVAVNPGVEPAELLRRTIAMVRDDPKLERALLKDTVETVVTRQLEDTGYGIGADGMARLPTKPKPG